MSMQIATNIQAATFDAALAQDAGLNVDVPVPASMGGYGDSRGVIQGIVLISEENLAWDILFWGKSAHGSTYDTDSYLGHWLFESTDTLAPYSNDVLATVYRYAIQGLGIPFQDLDARTVTSGALHITLVPRGAAHVIHKKIAITFFLSPEVPWSGA